MRTPWLPVALTILGLAVAHAGETWNDIVPVPKEAQDAGVLCVLPDDAAIVADGFPEARIGADEINHRLAELGADPLPVVAGPAPGASLVIRVTCPPRHPAQLAAWPGKAARR